MILGKGEQEIGSRIIEWMQKEFGKEWKVVSIARYTKFWVAIATHGTQTKEGVFEGDTYGALVWVQPIYRQTLGEEGKS